MFGTSALLHYSGQNRRSEAPERSARYYSATFVHPSDGNWKATLGLTCALIAERVIKLGTTDKPDPDKVAESDAIRTFCKRVTGAWWQRIPVKDVSAVSFFQIKRDTVFNSLSLSGSSYDKTGALVGYWESIMARIKGVGNLCLTVKKTTKRSIGVQGRLSSGILSSGKRGSQWARNGVGVKGSNIGRASA